MGQPLSPDSPAPSSRRIRVRGVSAWDPLRPRASPVAPGRGAAAGWAPNVARDGAWYCTVHHAPESEDCSPMTRVPSRRVRDSSTMASVVGTVIRGVGRLLRRPLNPPPFAPPRLGPCIGRWPPGAPGPRPRGRRCDCPAPLLRPRSPDFPRSPRRQYCCRLAPFSSRAQPRMCVTHTHYHMASTESRLFGIAQYTGEACPCCGVWTGLSPVARVRS